MPQAAWYASSVSVPSGSAICVALQFERRNMPAGMLRSQKDMGSPNTVSSRPLTVRRCAAADKP